MQTVEGSKPSASLPPSAFAYLLTAPVACLSPTAAMSVWKTLQKRLLSLLSYSTPLTILVFIVCITMLVSSSAYLFVGVLQTVTFGLLGTPNPYQQTGAPAAFGTAKNSYDNLHGHPFIESDFNPFPIDVVYTWVNGSDPWLQETLHEFKEKMGLLTEEEKADEERTENELKAIQELNHNKSETTNLLMSSNRFRDNNELRYSLRSLWKYAGWIRKVFIVTNGQIPNWLNLKHPRLEVIPHTRIFPDHSHLPTFSSPAIESHLHEIPGLSKFFIYFNDDIMLGNHVTPGDWFNQATQEYKIFLAWEIPGCAPGCSESWIKDGFCDKKCNNEDCQWDGGDCAPKEKKADPEAPAPPATAPRYIPWKPKAPTTPSGSTTPPASADSDDEWDGTYPPFNGGKSSTPATPAAAPADPVVVTCAPSCPLSALGNNVCDQACLVQPCAFDLGDCGFEKINLHFRPVAVTAGQTAYAVPAYTEGGKEGAMFNLSTIFVPARHSSITEASHDNSVMLTNAFVNTHTSMLFLLMAREQPHPGHMHTKPRRAEIVLGGTIDKVGSRVKQPISFTFNVTQPRLYNLAPGFNGDGTRVQVPKPPTAVPTPTSGTSIPSTAVPTTPAPTAVVPAEADEIDEDSAEENDVVTQYTFAQSQSLDDEIEEDALAVEQAEDADDAAENAAAALAAVKRAQKKVRSVRRTTRSKKHGKHKKKAKKHHTKRTVDEDEDEEVYEEPAPEPVPTPRHTRPTPTPTPAPPTKRPSAAGHLARTSEEQVQALMEGMKQRAASAKTKPKAKAKKSQGRTRGGRKLLAAAAADADASVLDNLTVDLTSPNDDTEARLMEMLRAREHDQKLLEAFALEQAQTGFEGEQDVRQLSLADSLGAANFAALPSSSRRLLGLDLYGGSLRFVHNLYNKHFKLSGVKRFAAAHMPHMLDREILYEMGRTFPQEINDTSRAHFRQKSDMQFAFAYSYFIVHAKKQWVPLVSSKLAPGAPLPTPTIGAPEPPAPKADGKEGDAKEGEEEDAPVVPPVSLVPPNVDSADLARWCTSFFDPEIWHKDWMDANADGSLDLNEVANMVTWLVGGTSPMSAYKEKNKLRLLTHDTYEALHNISLTVYVQDPEPSRRGLITKDLILNNRKLLDKIKAKYETTPKYKHTMGDKNAVKFHMIGSDYTRVQRELSDIYASKPKFVCLNDDMGDAEPTSTLLAETLEATRETEEREFRDTLREVSEIEAKHREKKVKQAAEKRAASLRGVEDATTDSKKREAPSDIDGYYGEDGDWIESAFAKYNKKQSHKPAPTPIPAPKKAAPTTVPTPKPTPAPAAPVAAPKASPKSTPKSTPKTTPKSTSKSTPIPRKSPAPTAKPAAKKGRSLLAWQDDDDEENGFVSPLDELEVMNSKQEEKKKAAAKAAAKLVKEEPLPADVADYEPLPPLAPQLLLLSRDDPQRRSSLKDDPSANEAANEDELAYFARIEESYAIAKHRVLKPQEHVRLRIQAKEDQLRGAVDDEFPRKQSWPPVDRRLSKHYSIQLVQAALTNYYDRYFPTPCEFELPAGKTNAYLHLSEYVTHLETKAASKFWAHALYFLIALCFVACATWRYLRQIRVVAEATNWAQHTLRTYGLGGTRSPRTHRDDAATPSEAQEMVPHKGEGLAV